MKWLENHTQEVLSKLGERYNDEFNIDTRASLYLSLFVHDDRALQYFNEKKSMLLKKVDELGWKYDAYAEYKDNERFNGIITNLLKLDLNKTSFQDAYIILTNTIHDLKQILENGAEE